MPPTGRGPQRGATYELSISLDNDQLEPEAFARAVLTFAELLKAADKGLSDGRQRVRWRLSRLSYASPAIISFAGIPAGRAPITAPQTVGLAVLDSIEALERGDRPPALSETGLERVRSLAAYGEGKNGMRIQIEERTEQRDARPPVRLTTQSLASVDRIIGAAFETFGAIQGRLEVISSRRGLTCVIHDEVSGRAVKCNVPVDLKGRVLGAFEGKVLALGRIHRDASGIPRLLDLQDVEVLNEAEELPQSLAGIDPDITDGKDTVAYLKERW